MEISSEIQTTIQRALEEDIGSGDATSQAIIPPEARMKALIIAKQEGVVAGLDVAKAVFLMVDKGFQFDVLVSEGQRVSSGDILAKLSGPAQAMLVAASHYFCGGILVDQWGRSSITNLYAAGEVTCTCVHGANRLASTSLLEGLVWGNQAAQHIEARFQEGDLLPIPGRKHVPTWDESGLTTESDPALIQGDMQTIQNIMWHYVGLERSAERLSRAMRDLRNLWSEIETFYRITKLSDELIGLRNAVEAALIIARAAQHNRQSRGAHFRKDAAPNEGERLI